MKRILIHSFPWKTVWRSFKKINNRTIIWSIYSTVGHLSEEHEDTNLKSNIHHCVHCQKQQLELDMEQQTGSKWGKKCIKAVYCHPACLTYIQSTSCKMLGWMNHKLESRLLGEISTTSDMQMIPL